MNQVHLSILQKVPNAMATRDKVDLNVYGMEGVPPNVIEERLRRKVKKKMTQLEKELKRQFKIDIEDSKFRLEDYEMPDPRPKKAVPDPFRLQIPKMMSKMMGPPMMGASFVPQPQMQFSSMPPPPQGMMAPGAVMQPPPQALAPIKEEQEQA